MVGSNREGHKCLTGRLIVGGGPANRKAGGVTREHAITYSVGAIGEEIYFQ